MNYRLLIVTASVLFKGTFSEELEAGNYYFTGSDAVWLSTLAVSVRIGDGAFLKMPRPQLKNTFESCFQRRV